MKDIKLSIVTVTYNSEGYLRETLESVLAQQYHNYEYIVVDGGSDDKTLSILEEYKPLFNGRLRYTSEKDNGIYDAMNKGIGQANGDYIGLINSDDRYSKGCFEMIAQISEREIVSPDVIYSDLNLIDENGKKIGQIVGDASKLKKGMLINHPTCFVKRTVYETYGVFNQRYKIASDYEFMLRIYHKGCSFIKSNAVLAEFRIGGTSFERYESVIEKYKIQRRYYNIFYCLYIRSRGFLRCKIKPLLKNTETKVKFE